MKIKDLVRIKDFEIKEFWIFVDNMPDELHGKKYKKNINAYFKKNGEPKAKLLELNTDKDRQEWHATQGFIRRNVRNHIHMNRLRKHKEVHRQHIKDVKEKKIERYKVEKYGKLVPMDNKIIGDKSNIQQIEQPSPAAIRNELAQEYNRLIREGNPDTKELREQIHDQITELEKAIEGNNRASSRDTETSRAAENRNMLDGA